ncbi:MAG TPA: peptide MFS transporter [Candidatus Acidoferrales bacterium]|nr:peptide MFS transporter [Candidatus Acidoferrales bacterium]
MFKDHPRGLFVLFFTEMWERFGFYTVLAIFVLYLQENFHWDPATIGNIYGLFIAATFFLPLFGGMVSDRLLGYGRTIVLGAATSCAGYALLAIPTAKPALLFTALSIIAIGNGLFKPNTYVIVGNLYSQKDGSLKDAAFNIFYMGINLGAFLGPIAAASTKNFMLTHFHTSLSHAYNAAFGVCALGLLVSIAIFLSFRKYYKDADYRTKDAGAPKEELILTRSQEKERITSLLIIFVIIIFFWMAYYQNGFTMTLFAKNYTTTTVDRITYLLFDPISLLAIMALILSGFQLSAVSYQSSTKSRTTSTVIMAASAAIILTKLLTFSFSNPISPESFQSFNPLFILFLTPVIIGIFAWLNKKHKEPSSPGKIGLGMVITALAFSIMIAASIGLPMPGNAASFSRVGPYWLISSYFVITLAELFLSPMGISFVSKVAPPRMKGMMMGGWFAGQAIGSYLAGFVGRFYVQMQLWQFFLILVFAAIISAILILVFLKKLRHATDA